jgi:hypothetical protein
LADDEGLISVINPKNDKDTVFVKKSEITIDPEELKPSKKEKKKEKKKERENDPLADLGL